jgi:hypothetical protein
VPLNLSNGTPSSRAIRLASGEALTRAAVPRGVTPGGACTTSEDACASDDAGVASDDAGVACDDAGVACDDA